MAELFLIVRAIPRDENVSHVFDELAANDVVERSLEH
jgi:hypothetical protein